MYDDNAGASNPPRLCIAPKEFASVSLLGDSEGHPGGIWAVLATVRSDRKRRLFAVACLRRRLDLIDDPRTLRAIDLAEGYADGRVSDQELLSADLDAFQAYSEMRDARLGENPQLWSWQGEHLRRAACLLVTHGVYYAEDVADHARRAIGGGVEGWRRELDEESIQIALLREIVGPAPLPTVDPFWLVHEDSAVVQLAKLIDAEQNFSLLPILADALEDAGCNLPAMLDHCRTPIEHRRGCWLIDLLLGRD